MTGASSITLTTEGCLQLRLSILTPRVRAPWQQASLGGPEPRSTKSYILSSEVNGFTENSQIGRRLSCHQIPSTKPSV